MKTWVQLESDALTHLSQTEINGRLVNVYPSPYDVPVAMSGEYLKDQNVVRIEFEYLRGDETLRQVDFGGAIVFGVGQTSNRLCRIDFKLDQKAELPDDLSKTLSLAAERLGSAKRPANYPMAQEALARYQRKLFALASE